MFWGYAEFQVFFLGGGLLNFQVFLGGLLKFQYFLGVCKDFTCFGGDMLKFRVKLSPNVE
jgi:hypothetical protein